MGSLPVALLHWESHISVVSEIGPRRGWHRVSRIVGRAPADLTGACARRVRRGHGRIEHRTSPPQAPVASIAVGFPAPCRPPECLGPGWSEGCSHRDGLFMGFAVWRLVTPHWGHQETIALVSILIHWPWYPCRTHPGTCRERPSHAARHASTSRDGSSPRRPPSKSGILNRMLDSAKNRA